MLAGRVMPVVVVIHLLAVPSPVVALQRRMVPLHSSVVTGDYHAFATEPERPHVRSLHLLNIPLDALGLEGVHPRSRHEIPYVRIGIDSGHILARGDRVHQAAVAGYL